MVPRLLYCYFFIFLLVILRLGQCCVQSHYMVSVLGDEFEPIFTCSIIVANREIL